MPALPHYVVRRDIEGYQNITPERADDLRRFEQFGERSFGDEWNAVKMVVYAPQERLLHGDYPALLVDVPVFSQRAVNVLGDLLLPNGELLPVQLGDEELFAFNVTRTIDALDYSQSEVDRFKSSGRVKRVRSIVLRSDVKLFDFFRLDGLHTPFLVSERFRGLVEGHGLKGFLFEDPCGPLGPYRRRLKWGWDGIGCAKRSSHERHRESIGGSKRRLNEG